MKYFEQKFTAFMNISLRILFTLILIGSTAASVAILIKLSAADIVKLLLFIALLLPAAFGIIYLVYRYFIREKRYDIGLAVILILAFIVRLAWILLVYTKPYSDFRVIYECARQFANGNYWVFKGTNYIGRFPHLTMLTIYLGMFQKLFSNPLLAIKFVNVILSIVNVYLIYLMGSELYNSKEKGSWCALIAALFPPFIIYNSVGSSENIAMPFFLGSIYIFIIIVKNKKNLSWFLLSGLLLSMGNLFRMVAYVVVIAYIMYLVIYLDKKKAAKSSVLILVSFLIPLFMVNSLLLSSGITEYPLWRGSEPSITSVLKGTNINYIGMWSPEDGNIPKLYNYDYKAVDSAARSIIMERLTSTPFYKLIAFYILKFTAQWSLGDFSAINWSTEQLEILNTSADLSTIASLFSQLFYIGIIIFVFKGLFNKKQYKENKLVNLFYIIFCGYGLFYLITEMQPRYGYIISWAFVILAVTRTDTAFMLKRKKGINALRLTL